MDLRGPLGGKDGQGRRQKWNGREGKERSEERGRSEKKRSRELDPLFLGIDGDATPRTVVNFVLTGKRTNQPRQK